MAEADAQVDPRDAMRASHILKVLGNPSALEALHESIMDLGEVIGLDNARAIMDACAVRTKEMLDLFGDDVIPETLLNGIRFGVGEWATLKFNVSEMMVERAAAKVAEHVGEAVPEPLVKGGGYDIIERGPQGFDLKQESTEHTRDADSDTGHTIRRWSINKQKEDES